MPNANTNFRVNGTDYNSTASLLSKDTVFENYPDLVGVLKTPVLYGAGWNYFGQLGIGTNGYTNVSIPTQNIGGGYNWKSVARPGFDHNAALKTDGTLWLWGVNGAGQLGDNTGDSKSSPVQTVSGGSDWKLVSCGAYYTAAIKTDGSLWLWGLNDYGQMGDNTTTNKSSPVQTVSAGTDWYLVACGDKHTAAIKTDGTLWSWGKNSNGELGDNTTTNRSSPVQTVSAGTDWKLVSCSRYHTAAIKTDGTLWSWGSATNGYLGNNSTFPNQSSPVQTVSAGTNWKYVNCGDKHTLAIKTDGTLWAWGRNSSSQLGDGTSMTRSSPVQTSSAGTNWSKIANIGPRSLSSGAFKTDGTLWVWGQGQYNQLDPNSTNNISNPVLIPTTQNQWREFAMSERFIIGIRDDSDDPV